MTGKFAKLTQNWGLRGWVDAQWAVVNWMTAKWFKLTQKEFYVAEACDGRTNFDSLLFLPEHLAILDGMVKRGIARACQEGDSIESWQKYRKADNPRLSEIHWCVTGLCNLNCLHCYMQSPSGRYGELPFDDMIRILEQFEQANVVQVSLTGGEPFIRSDLLDILAILAEKKIWVREIYTNGLLITEEILDQIKRIGLTPSFQISFDGVGGHEYMRGRKGIEKRVIQSIRRVRAAGFPVFIAGNVDKVNAGCLGETYDLLRALDIQAWRLGTPLSLGNWRGATTGLSLDEEADVYTPILEQWLKDGRPFELALGIFFRAPGKGFAVEEEPEDWCTPESYDCGSCRVNPNLMPDGTLLPCTFYVDSLLQDRMPNILSQGLSKVWTDSILRRLADIKKSDLLAQNEECSRCNFFGKCGAGCRASALKETGNLMARDPVICMLWKGGYKQRFKELAR